MPCSDNQLRLLEAAARVAASQENEGTDSPWWGIVEELTFPPRHRGQIIILAGPFFSRERAEDYFYAKRYNFPKAAKVWCFSGYQSREWKELYQASKEVQNA